MDAAMLYNATQDFLRQARADLHPALRRWLLPDAAEWRLRATIMQEVRLIGNHMVARRYYDLCRYPNTQPSDYLPRLIELDGGRRVLASVRFNKFDMTLPLVQIEQRGFPLESPEQVVAIAQQVAPHFAAFRPTVVRLPDSSGLLDQRPHPAITCEYRLVVAPFGVVRAQPTDHHDAALTLTRANDMTFYPQYVAAYQAFHADHPELVEAVPVELEEDMADYVNEDFVYTITINGTWAGVVTATPHQDGAMLGMMVADVILTPQFRGKGYGAAIQRQLARVLPGSDYDFLMGTISPDNTPSLKAAMRAGRVDVGGEFRVALGR